MRAGRGRRLSRWAEELGTDIIFQTPNDLVTATLRKLVGRARRPTRSHREFQSRSIAAARRRRRSLLRDKNVLRPARTGLLPRVQVGGEVSGASP